MTASTHDRSIQKICQAIIRKGDTPDSNTFIVSTGDRDRDNDTLDPNGWDLAAYQRNPVVLYGHQHADLPIAKCTNIGVVNGKLKAVIQWPPSGLFPFADTVKGMVQHGFVQSTSVGFRGGEWEPNAFGGKHYTRQELIEVSLVPIPSNPHVRMEKGVDRMTLKGWLAGSVHTQQPREDEMEEMYLEVSDDFYTKDDDAFAAMCASMLEAYSEMDSEKFRELMARQIALLGPNASISALVHAITQEGVMASRSWTPETFDIDPKELAAMIGKIVAEEAGRQTRVALCQLTGRLD